MHVIELLSTSGVPVVGLNTNPGPRCGSQLLHNDDLPMMSEEFEFDAKRADLNSNRLWMS